MNEMVKIKLIFLFFIFLTSVQNSNADNTKDPLQYFLTDLKTLEAKFVQILINENAEELEKTEGVLYLKSPRSFYWH